MGSSVAGRRLGAGGLWRGEESCSAGSDDGLEVLLRRPVRKEALDRMASGWFGVIWLEAAGSWEACRGGGRQ
jgi:hypothetical protein